MKDISTPTLLGHTPEELSAMPQQRSDAIRAATRIRASGSLDMDYSSLAYLCARACGLPVPLDDAAKNAAISALDTDAIIDPSLEARARAAKSELGPWGFELEKGATPPVAPAAPSLAPLRKPVLAAMSGPRLVDAPPVTIDPAAGAMGKMAGARPLALAGGRPTALAHQEDGLEPPAAPFEHRVRTWLAGHPQRQFKANADTSGDEVTIICCDVIGASWWGEGVTAKGILAALAAHPNAKVAHVLIDSCGGDAFEGIACQAILKRAPIRVEVEIVGECSSAATALAMGADKISIHEGGMFCVHEAMAGTFGPAKDHIATAAVLTKLTASLVDLYVAKTKRPRDELEKLVAAETWMNARECVSMGFADELIPAGPKAAA